MQITARVFRFRFATDREAGDKCFFRQNNCLARSLVPDRPDSRDRRGENTPIDFFISPLSLAHIADVFKHYLIEFHRSIGFSIVEPVSDFAVRSGLGLPVVTSGFSLNVIQRIAAVGIQRNFTRSGSPVIQIIEIGGNVIILAAFLFPHPVHSVVVDPKLTILSNTDIQPMEHPGVIHARFTTLNFDHPRLSSTEVNIAGFAQIEAVGKEDPLPCHIRPWLDGDFRTCPMPEHPHHLTTFAVTIICCIGDISQIFAVGHSIQIVLHQRFAHRSDHSAATCRFIRPTVMQPDIQSQRHPGFVDDQ